MVLAGCSTPMQVRKVAVEPSTLVINGKCGQPVVQVSDYLHVRLQLGRQLDLSGKSIQVDSYLDRPEIPLAQKSGLGYAAYRDASGTLHGWKWEQSSLQLTPATDLDAFVFNKMLWDTTRFGEGGGQVSLTGLDYQQVRIKLRVLRSVGVSDESNDVVLSREEIQQALTKPSKHYVIESDAACSQ